MEEVQRQMMANLQAMTPEQMMKTWMPIGVQGWEQMQRAFWGRPRRRDQERGMTMEALHALTSRESVSPRHLGGPAPAPLSARWPSRPP